MECHLRIESEMRICSLLSIQNVVELVRCGRLRWFGHLEHNCVDNCRGGRGGV